VVVKRERLVEMLANLVHVLEEIDEFGVDGAGAFGDRFGIPIAALDLPDLFAVVRGAIIKLEGSRRRHETTSATQPIDAP